MNKVLLETHKYSANSQRDEEEPDSSRLYQITVTYFLELTMKSYNSAYFSRSPLIPPHFYFKAEYCENM